MNANRYRLGWILLLALFVRLTPMLCEYRISPDYFEYQNIASNLLAGNGYRLDIKAYRVVAGPAPIYGGYIRPPLFPAVLAVSELVASPTATRQFIGPLLFLLTLALICGAVKARAGGAAAAGAGVLLALHPGLLETSLAPMSECTSLLALAFVIWACYRRQSAWLAGLGCALAFLARPNSIVAAGFMGLIFLIPAMARRQFKPLLGFAACAALGPLALVLMNQSMGVPPLTMPQSFLYRMLNFRHTMHLAHAGAVYPSQMALLHAQGFEVVRRIAQNGVDYLQQLIKTEGIGLLVPLLPLALLGVWRKKSTRLYLLLGGVAVLDLMFMTSAWATYDPWRFLSVTYLVAIVLVAIGTVNIFAGVRLDRGPRRRPAPARLIFLAIALLWFGWDMHYSAKAFAAWRHGHPYSDYWETRYTEPGLAHLRHALWAQQGILPGAIVASNAPWEIHDYTGLPAVILPYDLHGDEWRPYLDQQGVKVVAFHQGDWPAVYAAQRQTLTGQLSASGWKCIYKEGHVEAWLRPGPVQDREWADKH